MFSLQAPPQQRESLLTSSLYPDQFLSAFSDIPSTTSTIAPDQSTYEDTDDDKPEPTASSSMYQSTRYEIEVLSTEPVLLGKMTSQQEIRIKMKQVETLPGPKVELEMTFGAITLFITPRQLQLLQYLVNVLLYITPAAKSSDESNSNSTSINNREKSKEPDYDFYQQKFSSMSGVIGCNQQGWSSTTQDTIEDQFYRSTDTSTIYAGISESVMSSNSSMNSSITSSATSGGSKSRRRGIDADPHADISHFKVRVACIAMILLHDDILVECDVLSREAPLSKSSVMQLKTKAEAFFDAIQPVTNKATATSDITKISKAIENALEFHNLRLILTPIIIEGEEQRNLSGTMLKCSVSVPRAEIKEHLNDISISLLGFRRDGSPGSLPSRPEIMANYKQTRQIIKTSAGKRLAPPKTEVNISLSPCEMEFDISILDRISAVLYREPFSIGHLKMTSMDQESSAPPRSKGESKTEIKFDSSQFDFKLRFPVADLRPIHDPQRIPWWSRNVRPDYLLLHFQQLSFIYLFPSTFSIQANQIDVFYYVSMRANF